MRGFFRDIGKLLRAVKEMGVLRTGKYALFVLRARLMRMSDQKKDSHLGVKTRENVQLETLDVCSENKQHGFSFVPSSERMVRVMLANLPENLSQFSFVDFGSGEGRVLLVAAAFPFREVIGVEFAKELHELAIRNIAHVFPSSTKRDRITSLHLDATQFEIPRHECLLYFYNPFGEHIFEQVLKNIERAHDECGKKMFVLYQQVVAEFETDKTTNVSLLNAAPFLKERKVRFPTLWDRFLLGSHELHIFETRIPS